MVKRVGSAVEPFVVGQDPKRRAEIEAQLFKDFGPNDVLEEIWLSDIAVLTATIEYYRTLEAAVMLNMAKRHGLEQHLLDEFPDSDDPTLQDAVDTKAIREAFGEFTPFELKQLSNVADLITKMRRERERVYLLFERKRRPVLLNAVKVAETTGRESFAVENLSD